MKNQVTLVIILKKQNSPCVLIFLKKCRIRNKKPKRLLLGKMRHLSFVCVRLKMFMFKKHLNISFKKTINFTRLYEFQRIFTFVF